LVEIETVCAREVLDSRGNPTVEAEITTCDGVFRAMAPSGASTGTHEAVELRDGDARYLGNGVQKAVKNVKKIAEKITGENPVRQRELDQVMLDLDGTQNKANLGANSMLAVSMAAARAGAAAKGMQLYEYLAELAGTRGITLPIPQMNVINGGKHAGIENDPQEHMFMPVGAKSISEALVMSTEAYCVLKNMLRKKFGALATLVGDEGGFVPPIRDVRERLDIMTSAIEEAGYKDRIKIALDPASSEFYSKGKYTIADTTYLSGDLIDFYTELTKTYPIISIEDGMAEDDWDGWEELTKKLGHKVQITGDDLTVTNVKRISEAVEKGAANSLLLKVNQIGTVTEAIDAAKLAIKSGWAVTVSHRSGETEDTFIADLAVGLDAGQIKAGAPARSERLAKYNQLLRIEEGLGKKSRFFRFQK